MNSKLNVVEGALAESVAKSDPFDLSNLLLDQSFAESIGVRKLLTTVPARKPSDQDFMRVHPDPAYRGNFAMIELKDDRELYLVTHGMAGELSNEAQPYTLFTAINRQGVVRIWPVRPRSSRPSSGCGSKPTCLSVLMRCSRPRRR